MIWMRGFLTGSAETLPGSYRGYHNQYRLWTYRGHACEACRTGTGEMGTGTSTVASTVSTVALEREFFIDNLLVRIHFIIVMVRWTGLAP